MKIYKVTIEWETVIMAEDENSAIDQAESVIKHNDEPCSMVDATEITSISELPSGWEPICLPWGENAYQKTLRQLLK